MGLWQGAIDLLTAQINPKGGIDVNVQDQTSALFRYALIQEQKIDITLSSNVAVDDTVITVSAGHGFTGAPGERIVLFEDNRYIQQQIQGVTGTSIGLSIPIASQFSKSGAFVMRGNCSMNVNASLTPVDYKMQLRNFTVPIDISKIIVTMQHGNNVPDDGKFGGVAALGNGVYFRKVNSIIFNLGNYKENQDFKNVGGTVTYTEKAPGGTNATDIIFDLKKIFGQVIRMDPREDDIFKGVIRDKLDTLDSFSVNLVGSYTEGE